MSSTLSSSTVGGGATAAASYGKDAINIRRDVKDAFYRYKMPRIQSKIEGKGNGIKTVVSNMPEVAKALARPPSIVTKFFGNELGSIVHCDDKTSRYVVNGAHEAEKLQTVLDGFISKFVLCGPCENPETDLIVQGADSRSPLIFKQCKACGQRSNVDMTHRLIPFILKNPPPQPRKLKPSEEQQQQREEEATEPTEEQGMTVDESEFAALHNAKSSLDDDWAEADAQAMRQAELEGLSEAVKSSLNLKTARDPLEEFSHWLKLNDQSSTAQIAQYIAAQPDLESHLAVVVVVQTLFDVDNAPAVFAKRLDLLQELVTTPADQSAFLYSLERLVGVHRVQFLPQLPALLQAAYNADIVDEEAINVWFGKISKRYVSKEVGQKVRKTVEAFIEWLNQDEDDEDEDE